MQHVLVRVLPAAMLAAGRVGIQSEWKAPVKPRQRLIKLFSADCAPGTCYEGACPGDKVYSTDGTCGAAHGYRLCAGVWGNCCNSDGRCGTGEDFCAVDVCQSGNCRRPVVQPSDPPWAGGNTTDGTCGDENRYSCNVIYGRCCNKDNVCGSLDSDCGVGW